MSRAQTPLVRGGIHSKNLSFAVCTNAKRIRKRASDERKKHSRTSPESTLTKQKNKNGLNEKPIRKKS